MSEYKFYDWSFARISGVFGGLVYVFGSSLFQVGNAKSKLPASK